MVDAVTLPCSPEVSFYSKSLANKFAYDPLRFVSFLNGYNIPRKDGKTREMTLLVNSQDSARTRIARSIAASLTELGLPTKTQESGGVTYKNTIVNANYDVYLGMTRLSPNMDLTEFFRDWGEMSWGQLNVASLYDMCNMALQNEGNYYNFYQKLAEDGRIIPLMFGHYNVYAQRGLMPDLNPSRDNVFYYSLGRTMDGIEIQPDYSETAED